MKHIAEVLQFKDFKHEGLEGPLLLLWALQLSIHEPAVHVLDIHLKVARSCILLQRWDCWNRVCCKQLSSSFWSKFQFVALHIAACELDHRWAHFRMDNWFKKSLCFNKVGNLFLNNRNVHVLILNLWHLIFNNIKIFFGTSTSRSPLLLSELVAALQHTYSSTLST